MEFLAAGLGALLVTFAQLKHEHGRWPVGDIRCKAAFWWLGVCVVDAFVACLAVGGLLNVGLAGPQGLTGVARAAALGVMAPLALRSPVRKAQIRGRDQQVGITYVYDVVRAYCVYSLDERMTRLRRTHTQQMVGRVEGLGWAPTQVVEVAQKHLATRRFMDDDLVVRASGAIDQALTLPSRAEQFEAILLVVESERLSAVRDELLSGPPPLGASEGELTDAFSDGDAADAEADRPI